MSGSGSASPKIKECWTLWSFDYLLSLDVGPSIDPIIHDNCTYTCGSHGSCRVKHPSGGVGSCFPPDFGGSCIATPSGCQDCIKVIDCSLGASVKEAKAFCEYNCEPNGKCNVAVEGVTEGPRKGFCFPEEFGGECVSTPKLCTKCKLKCMGRAGEKFKEEVWFLTLMCNNLTFEYMKEY